MGELRSAVDVLAALDPDDLEANQLGELIADTLRERDRLDAVCHRLVAAHDRRQLWKREGARSEKQWLAERCRLSAGEAAGRAETARRLERLPATLEAATGGQLSAGQARVAAQAARDVPAEALASLDQLVVRSAPGTDTGELRRAVDDFAHRLTPDSLAERERRAYERRRLTVTRTGDGGVAIEGRLDVLGGETVLSALAPLAAPRDTDDERSPDQRRADALVELARRALDHGGLAEVAGCKPHVTVVVDLETLRGRPGAPPAGLDRLGGLSGEAARLLACDAGVTRVVTNGRSQMLDVGRETRTVPTALRRALAVRDRGCTRCRAPMAWCEAHHLRHWADGGPTNMDNLVMLCPGCHRDLHRRRRAGPAPPRSRRAR